jgi:hypothetical protein
MENSEERQSILDEEHLRLLSLFHYIKGGITVGFSFFGLLYFVFIVLIMKVGNRENYRPNNFPTEFFSYLVVIVGVIVTFILVFGVLQLLSAYYMRRGQNRIFSFVIGIIECLEIPYGTILGVMTIIVLSRHSVKQRYQETPVT